MRTSTLSLAARRAALVIALLALGCPTVGYAQSPTETCVEVVTQRADPDALKRLVLTELDRFPTHRSAEDNCGSYLRVEVIDLADGTYVTGRINTQVPHREKVAENDMAEAVERMLRIVLHNDPVRLRGPRSQNFIRRGLRALRTGVTLYGAELYQTTGLLEGEPLGLPGVAVVVRRETTDWHLGARVAYAGRFDTPPTDALNMTGHLAVQLQVMWHSSDLDDTSWYVGGVAGMDHQRFQGPAPGFGSEVQESYSQTGLALGGRAGVELFRTTTGRLDLFTQLTVPVFVSHDEEGGVVDSWLPTLQVGAGMLF